ncbi:MAG: sulfite exporter TauE/SafE family protein [Proteobacteria bacterium]|nr:sulfite exporter TauE/SafE family protein [Pseudomonadota bacterium]
MPPQYPKQKMPKKTNHQKNYNTTFQNILTLFLTSAVAIICTVLYFKVDGDVNIKNLTNSFLIGIIAQLIDGAIGMAYGLTATTFLLSQGVSPIVASSSIHIAEVFTTGASGLSHWRLNNIDKKLFLNLIFPGIIGGLVGVFILTNIDGKILKPWISIYLALMGIFIIFKALKKRVFINKINAKKITPLALAGGIIDAIGGGGWGPVVTTTLLSRGHEPKKTIGSVNSAEFFITTSTGFSFAIFVGINEPEIIAGLILGGIISAPFAAKITTRLPTSLLMIIVGTVIASLSVITILKNFGLF